MLNKDLLTTELVNGVLTRMLKGKVRSGAKHDRLSPYDVRRINTYTDILNGKDWSMREELFSETCVWLLENPLLVTIEESGIEFLDDAYYHYCKHIDRYMEKQANLDGWVEKKVTKKREDGTTYRTSVYECRKLMYDVSDSTDENPVLLKLDSKALKDYLLQDCADVDKDFIDLLYDYKARYINGKSEKRRLYWNCFYAYIVVGLDVESIANMLGKSTDTIYRWIRQVKDTCCDFIKEDRRKREVKKTSGIITNSPSFSHQGKKGWAYVVQGKGSICHSAGFDKLISEEVKKINSQECCFNPIDRGYFDFSVYDEYINAPYYTKVGYDWLWVINNTECWELPIKKEKKVEKRRTIKYIPRKSAHGQGDDYYHVALPHVRESDIIPLDVWFDNLPDEYIIKLRDMVRFAKAWKENNK